MSEQITITVTCDNETVISDVSVSGNSISSEVIVSNETIISEVSEGGSVTTNGTNGQALTSNGTGGFGMPVTLGSAATTNSSEYAAASHPTITGTITIGTGTWDGDSFTGPQDFAERPTCSEGGTPAADSLMTRDDGDTRYKEKIVIVKTTNEDRTLTTTYAADSVLTRTLEVGTYQIEIEIKAAVSINDGTGIKTQLAFSGTANGALNADYSVSSTTNVVNVTRMSVPHTISGSLSFPVVILESNNRYQSIKITGVLIVSVQGTLAIEWAQFASSANPARVKLGSYMMITDA